MSVGFRCVPPQCIIQIWFRSVQCSRRRKSPKVRRPARSGAPSQYVRSPRLYHDGQEVSGSVFPTSLLPPHRLAVGIQSHKHVLFLVAPLCWSVGVVLVLLDAFDQAAVRTKVPLKVGRRCKECKCQIERPETIKLLLLSPVSSGLFIFLVWINLISFLL